MASADKHQDPKTPGAHDMVASVMPRTLNLHGKTALVTGASSGIGRAIAHVLARDVSTLVLAARRRERLDVLAREIASAHASVRVLVHDVDLANQAATEAMIDALEKDGVAIDVLVNNAGFGDRGLISGRPWPKLHSLLELNVVGATFLIHRLLPGMLTRGSGGILNIGSVAGIITKPGSAVYGASKSYLNALSEALHAELRGTGVVVTAVLPGPVPTEFGDMAAKLDADPVGTEKASKQDASERSKNDPIKMPNVLTVSAEQCAEEAVKALKAGKARVVPGAAVQAMALVMDNLPRPIVRAVLGRAATKMRGRE